MILVSVAKTFLVNMGKDFIMLLRGTDDQRTLPISIGQLEAQSIAIVLNQVPFPRPLTHDLFKSVMTEIGCQVKRVEVNDLSDGTFYARLIIDMHGAEIEIDSRPSDAIALALRFAAPIYVYDKVMDEAGVIIPDENRVVEEQTSEGLEELEAEIGDLTAVEVLQRQLDKAIQEERYEDAARLRDEIVKMAKSN